MSIVLIASLAPVIALLVYIYVKDKYEKEPLSMLLKALLGGVLSAILTVILLMAFEFATVTTFANDISKALYDAFCQAALPEEACKLFFLYLFIWKSKYFNEYYDGIEYAVCVGLGFAGLENILYVMNGGMGVAIARAIFAVPAHFFFAIFMGYFFALAKFRPWQKSTYLTLAFIVPVILHGLYDFFLMYQSAITETSAGMASLISLVFFVFFILVWRLAVKRINKIAGR